MGNRNKKADEMMTISLIVHTSACLGSFTSNVTSDGYSLACVWTCLYLLYGLLVEIEAVVYLGLRVRSHYWSYRCALSSP